MVDIVTWYTYKNSVGEKNEEPSLTIDDGYEDLESMVNRIIRGDIPAMRAQQYYEYGDDSQVKDSDFDSPVVDDLDDLTDIDVARNVMTSAVGSAHCADTLATADGDKHGASEADKANGESSDHISRDVAEDVINKDDAKS